MRGCPPPPQPPQMTRSPRCPQANARLEAYAALGPRFFSLAAEHAELQRMIGEIEYEVAEVERFALLAGGGRA